MSEAEIMHTEAMAIIRLASGKLDWCANAEVLKRYANVPASLEDIRMNAEVALRGGRRMERYAAKMAEREKEPA